MSEVEEKQINRRVLVVDDDPVVRLLASQTLAAGGFEIEEAEDGDAGLAAIAANPPALVLLDVEMPGRDGFETCAEIRRIPGGENIAVLIATGHTDAETIDRAFRAGATDFISKPLDLQILQHRVRFLMRAYGAFGDLRHTLTELRASEVRLANAQRLARIGHWEWEPDSPDMLWSEEVYRIFGVELRAGASSFEAFLGAAHPEDRLVLEKAMREAVVEARAFSLDHRVGAGEGERVVHQQAEVTLGSDGKPERVTGTIQDITERRRSEERIRQLAFYDSLTGLPNRRMLADHLARVLERARSKGENVALLFLDLDRFKRVNDTLGHGIGDELLKAVAGRLVSCVRGTDQIGRPNRNWGVTLSRLGGDEFTVVLNGLREPDEAGIVARRILEVMRKPFDLQGHEIVMGVSIGIALSPPDGCDAELLLRNADAAMYAAKAQGRNVYQFFSEAMNEKAMRALRLENALRSALERDELTLHFQPQVDVRSGRIVALEALARWQSPEFGPISPAEFVPLAEETGLIATLGDWVLRAACRQMRVWRDAGLPALRVAVNVSSHQIRERGLVRTVETVLEETGLEPSDLEIEITESALLANEPVVVETLEGLRRLGTRVALDDFGTGYSSLSHLVRFPFDALKIDRCFVSNIGTEQQGAAIIAAVVAMAHRLGLTVTAEGVESEEQEEFLRREGCDLLQGYRIARPADAAAMEARLRGAS